MVVGDFSSTASPNISTCFRSSRNFRVSPTRSIKDIGTAAVAHLATEGIGPWRLKANPWFPIPQEPPATVEARNSGSTAVHGKVPVGQPWGWGGGLVDFFEKIGRNWEKNLSVRCQNKENLKFELSAHQDLFKTPLLCEVFKIPSRALKIYFTWT